MRQLFHPNRRYNLELWTIIFKQRWGWLIHVNLLEPFFTFFFSWCREGIHSDAIFSLMMLSPGTISCFTSRIHLAFLMMGDQEGSIRPHSSDRKIHGGVAFELPSRRTQLRARPRHAVHPSPPPLVTTTVFRARPLSIHSLHTTEHNQLLCV